ncbi:unnamed protein product [Acanthoscelides obtectus]|uniref:Pre-rRNA-processing protein TSR2 homolog n=1 Tax=Acanthoscelides obtectus TaxID=200917 RepID=A0A9P0Q4H4_ACAOB|nr:unnamed protein product [Acanthoscelides obtectus]CAK1656615.1 Pre-rRNA-processing protein TSR2 homolog [Acanthoscelides obtectus]
MDPTEEAFTKIVQHIFNNWTALRLAVEHSMGGCDSKQTALDFMNYMVQFCLYERNVDVGKIQEALEDILDEEFETICEDGSTQEVAVVLHKFLKLLRDGNLQDCETEYQKLPTINAEWLKSNIEQVKKTMLETSSSSEDEEEQNTSTARPTTNQRPPSLPTVNETPMDEDGWTEVRNKKKR